MDRPLRNSSKTERTCRAALRYHDRFALLSRGVAGLGLIAPRARRCYMPVVVAVAVLSAALPPLIAVAEDDDAYRDVPADAYYAVPVQTLAADGIFDGTLCDDGFCPSEPIDRKTMAVWVVRVLDVEDPPTISRTRFNDVDAASFFAPFIERMAELGITTGCSDGSSFCPDRQVTRAEMAVFLSRSYNLPDGPDPGFADVPSDAWYAPEVARLANSGITVGCKSGTAFCPGGDTTRGEMTTFLFRATTWLEAQRDAEGTFADVADAEAYMVELVNELRASLGRPALVAHPGVAAVARAWSNEMANSRELVHNPSYTEQIPSGSTGRGENIASTPSQAVDRSSVYAAFWGLSRSPGHYANMIEDRFSHIGVGIAYGSGRVWITQNFACYPSHSEERSCNDSSTEPALPTEVLPPEPYSRSTIETYLCRAEQESTGTYTAVEVNTYNVGQVHAVRTDGTLQCVYFGSRAPSGLFISLSLGNRHACGLRTDKTLACWGTGPNGYTPSGEFLAVSAGDSHSCALRIDSSIVCWGFDYAGETKAPGGDFKSVTAGSHHSCGLRFDATIVCWGHSRYIDSPSGEFVSIDTGSEHSCGVRTDGTAICWGLIGAGIGDIPAGIFESVYAGDGTSCGIRTNGAITCWGRGLGDNRFPAIPTGEFSQLSMGLRFDCGLRTDGTIVCWGNDNSGGTLANRDGSDFTTISSLGLTKLSHGSSRLSGCGLRADRSAVCWGVAVTFPDADFVPRFPGLPVRQYGSNEFVVSSGEYTEIATTGLYDSTLCLLQTDGRVSCSGGNKHFVQSVADAKNTTFTALAAAPNAAIPAACGIKSDATLKCWGFGAFVADVPDGKFTAVSVGSHGEAYACAVRTDGTLACWGNAQGDIGNIPGDDSIPVPSPPSGRYLDVSVGDSRACALRIDHSVVCWSWQLGSWPDAVSYRGLIGYEKMLNGQRLNVFETPRGSFKSVSVVYRDACGIRSDDSVQCWGPSLQSYALDGSFTVVEGQCGLQADSSFACRATLLAEGITWSRHPIHCSTSREESPSDTTGTCELGTQNRLDQVDAIDWIPPVRRQYSVIPGVSYSGDFLRQHRSRPDKCWIGIGRLVYDVTPGDNGYEYAGPGSLLDLCGTNASDHYWSNDIRLPDPEHIKGSFRW